MKKIITLSCGIIFSLNAFTQAPPWVWAHSAGSPGWDEGHSVAVDAFGNSYITGKFYDTATFGAFSIISTGGPDVFVAKYNSGGNCLWVKKGGGVITSDVYADQGHGIDVDANSNCYVTGTFLGAATFGPFNVVSSGAREIFVAKYDMNGNVLWIRTPTGGLNNNQAQAIATDSAANCYITGSLGGGTNIFGSDTLTGAGTFVAKYDSSGSVMWARKIGMNGNTEGYSIDVDPWGNSCLIGYLTGTENFGSFSLTSTGLMDVFVAKVDVSGNLLWAKRFGSTLGAMADGYGISTDAQGNIFITGRFEYNLVFGSTTLWATSSMEEAFIAKLDSAGNPLWAGQSFTTGGSARGHCIKAYPNGNSLIAGYYLDVLNFCSFTFPTNGSAGFFIKYDAAGNCLWTKYTTGFYSGTSTWGIAIDNAGGIIMAGYYKNTPTFDTITPPLYGDRDIFIAKLNEDENPNLINELNFSSGVTIFPNPATNQCTIYDVRNTISNIEIYNTMGKKVFSELITNNRKQVTVNVANFPLGIYFVKIKGEQQEHVAKFVKQ